MTPEQALTILVKAAIIGQKAGAYDLESARNIANAVDVFSKKTEDGNNTTTDNGETKEEIPSEESPA
jgi:hypothetical protein